MTLSAAIYDTSLQDFQYLEQPRVRQTQIFQLSVNKTSIWEFYLSIWSIWREILLDPTMIRTHVRKPASSIDMLATAAVLGLISRLMYSLPPPERSESPKGIVEYPTYRPGSIITAGLSSAVIWEINAPLWVQIHQPTVFLDIIVSNGQNCPSDLVVKTCK